MIGLYEKAMPEAMSLRQKMEITAGSGFDFLELSIDESDAKLVRLDWTVEEFASFEKDMRETGVRVLTMCLSGHRRFPLGSRDPKIRERSLEIMSRAVDFAVRTGIRVIQIAGYDVYYEKSGADTEKFFYENLKKSVELASKSGVILAFEIMETPFMNTVKKAMKYVKKIDSPYLRIYPDIGNVRNGADKYLEDIKSGKGYIAAAHLKETAEGVYRDMFFGEGRVDFDGCIKELKSQGVGLYVCEFWYDGKTPPLEYVIKARRFFERFSL